MSGHLEPPHEQLTDEVPGVQGIGRRIEADVQRDRTGVKAAGERIGIGAVVHEPTCTKVGEKIAHGAHVASSAASFLAVSATTVVGVQPAILDTLRRQATGCKLLGSAIYSQLLDAVAEDYEVGGVSQGVLDGVTEKPFDDALALRLMAAVHRLALAGSVPALARHYPSCGGEPGPNILADFWQVLDQHAAIIRAELATQVQTNEIGRTCALAPGLAFIAASTGLPLRTLEIGASAGLLSRMPWFFFDTGLHSAGPADSAVRFGAEWFGSPPPPVASIEVAEQRASDLYPIDVSSPAGYHRALSFVFPDHTDRIARLSAAVDVARDHPLSVEQADAAVWLDAHATVEDSAATVVFHSIMWQYLPHGTQHRIRSLLAARGAQATPSATFHWLRFEPFDATRAELRLTTWPGGEERQLALAGYHGAAVTWLG
jgi:hypothetical protein